MPNRFRVLHLRASNFFGGPERQLLNYAKLPLEGEVETVIASFVGDQEGVEFLRVAKEQGVETVGFPVKSLTALSYLSTLLRDERYSLLCTHGYKADVLGLLAGKRAGVPVVPFLRGWTGESLRVSLYEFVDRLLLPLSTRIVCLSERQRKRIQKYPSLKSKLRIVVNAIEGNQTPSGKVLARKELMGRFGIDPEQFLVAAAGRLSPEKGTRYLIEAARDLVRQFPNIRFLIFGDGSEALKLKEQVAELELEGKVQFGGHVSDFGTLLPGVNILVNPSLSEEMPNVVLEAMSMGVPTIATGVGGVSEIAGDGGAIWLIPPAQVEAITESARILIQDPSRLRELGEAGRRRVNHNFSLEIQHRQLLALYREIDANLPATVPFRIKQAPAETNEGKGVGERRLPFISLVMPVRNEEKHLGAVLEQLITQDYPPDRYEILVADGNSTDRTCEIAKQYSLTSRVKLTVLANPAQLSSAGRNVGIQNSQGDIIVFVDGHCTINSRRLLRDTAEIMHESDADCLCRPQPLTSDKLTWFQVVVANTRASFAGHGRDSTIFSMGREGFVNPTSSGATYRRSVFDRVGLYDTNFDACEDVEFNYRVFRAGLRSFISPKLAVYYEPRGTLSKLFKQMERYGRGRYRFMRKHPSSITIAQLIPPGFVLWLLLLLIGAIWLPLASRLFLLSFVTYVAAVAIVSMALSLRYGWKYLIAAPFVFGAIHFGLGLGFLKEAIQFRFSQRHRISADDGSALNCED